ncbi:hypothetical protein [Devosia sp. A16]|uniref:hypothetical protein n=1 Tax=Devosia sp. A16 TaxID=1736675 RepID=UPI0006D7C985|nr:hypothetical protein [Devosia sp. A16]
MTTPTRIANARAAARSYAPKPNGTALTYGLIAAALTTAAAIIADAYFRTDVVGRPVGLAVIATLAFASGAVFRFWRQRRYVGAFRAEYVKRTPTAPVSVPAISGEPAGVKGAHGSDEELEFVTFRSAFLLPGLTETHPPGTFEVRLRKEPLDVSWGAFRLIKTIMLTGHGVIEALEVKEDDLAAALKHDANPPQ